MLPVKNLINFTSLSVFAVGLLATSGDITMSWTSPIYPKLYSNDTSKNPLGRPITAEEDSWIGSLINIGAMIGSLVYGYIAEKFGRKIGLLCIALPHLTAYVTMAFAETIYLFYFGRFFGGLAVGGGYTLMPMYIAEVTEDSNRGMYSVTLGIFWALGSFLPYAIGPFLSIKIFNLILACFPLTFLILFSLAAPETPYYLVAQKKIEKAEKVLMYLRSGSKKEVEQELTKMKDAMQKETHGKLMDIFNKRSLRKALFISLALITFQQFAGCNAISFYLQPILNDSNMHMSSDLGSVVFGLCSLAFSLICPFVIERFGRKFLTILSAVGNGVFLVLLGGYFFIKDSTDLGTNSIKWLPIFCLILEIFMFQLGWNVTPWTISSELFPTSVKQISATAVSLMCWLTSFIMTKYFNALSDLLTAAGVFWFFGCMGFACGLFTYFFVPETKGKSVADIQEML